MPVLSALAWPFRQAHMAVRFTLGLLFCTFLWVGWTIVDALRK